MHGTEDNFKEAKIISRERWQKQHPESIKVKKGIFRNKKRFLRHERYKDSIYRKKTFNLKWKHKLRKSPKSRTERQ